jgi:hypothetical protein
MGFLFVHVNFIIDFKKRILYNLGNVIVLLTMHILLITRAKKLYIAKIVSKGTHFVAQVLPPTFWAIICRTSLKIPKGQSESVYRRRTDKTIAKRKYVFKRGNRFDYCKTVNKQKQV